MAIGPTHPDEAAALWKALAAEEIARTNRSGYEASLRYLRRLRRLLTEGRDAKKSGRPTWRSCVAYTAASGPSARRCSCWSATVRSSNREPEAPRGHQRSRSPRTSISESIAQPDVRRTVTRT